jgi:hypothetical protein
MPAQSYGNLVLTYSSPGAVDFPIARLAPPCHYVEPRGSIKNPTGWSALSSTRW